MRLFSVASIFANMLLVCGIFCAGYDCDAQTKLASAVDVRMVTDEAEAVLSVLSKRKANQAITEADWQRIFQSEGYIRLKRRELGMKRQFEDADFKVFVLSDLLLERSSALAETLEKWKRAEMADSARLALAYLPKNARISAKIYPVIKPRENSFVDEINIDPAIFLYLDPQKSKEKFQNDVAHEMHHIGYGTACPSKRVAGEIARLPKNAQTVLTWLGAFGEGFAMLAAAGGANVHPHAVSDAEERTRWDKDLTNFNVDLKRVERFFLDVLENRVTGEDVEKTARSFYGVQGPWYTVGWKMAVTIEKTYGRRKLIECMCDERKLLRTYNNAAARHNRKSSDPLAVWSPSVINGISSRRY